MTQQPDSDYAVAVASAFCGVPVRRLRRFKTGLMHFVYDVVMADDRQLVVRASTPAHKPLLEGAQYWSRQLRPRGVPLPRILACELDGRFPYLLLERLPGRDLGHVYDALGGEQLRRLAEDVQAIQHNVAQLPAGPGFGFVIKPVAGAGLRSWRDVVAASLTRSERRIDRAGVFDGCFMAGVREHATRFDNYFAACRPTPFLDDVTLKNVLVHDGRLSGIVDVDQVCFGDPLFTVALTRMSVLSAGLDSRYIGYWLDACGATDQQRRVLDFYTLLFCVDFMSEVGQRFNRAKAVVDQAWAEKLRNLHSQLLAALVDGAGDQ